MVTETPAAPQASLAPTGPGTADGTGIRDRQLVEFELGGESYGVDIGSIREIIRYQTVTVLPGAPEIVEGIINLRGRVTPIVDLRLRLNLDSSEVNDSTRIIVIHVDDALVGVHVDAVTGVISLSSDQVQPLSGDLTTDRSSYLEGVADLDGRLVVLINLQQALEGDVVAAVPSPGGDALATAASPAAAAAPTSTAATPATAATTAPESTAPEPIPATSEATPADEAAETVEGEPASEPPLTGDVTALGLRVELLEQSFEVVKAEGEALAARFYENLFAQHPAMHPFLEDVAPAEREGGLLSAVTTFVASLRQPDVLIPHLEELGRRHVAAGVEPAHYEAAGTVLVETLGEIAGDRWTDEIRDAWSDALSLVATVMIDAASEVEPPNASAVPAANAPAVPPVSDETKPAVPKPTPRKSSAKKPAAKTESTRPAAKRSPARKPAAKQAAGKKPVAKTAAAKPQAAKKKPAARATAAKQRTAKKKATGTA